jgi:RNA polymerase sigma-70 factor, ECF subfamily
MNPADLTVRNFSLGFSKAATRNEKFQHLFQLLYDQHYESCYRFLAMTGSSPDDALELLQEGFLRLYESLQNGVILESPRNWLFRVLKRLRVDEFRRTSRVSSYAEFPEHLFERSEKSLNPETHLLNRERAERLRGAVGQLTATQYQYLLLRAEGLKFREIADLHGVAAASVFETCGRALKRLGKLTDV